MPRTQKIASSLKTTSTSSKEGRERDDNPVENEDGEERKKKSSTSTTAANRTENHFVLVWGMKQVWSFGSREIVFSLLSHHPNNSQFIIKLPFHRNRRRKSDFQGI